MFENLTEKLSKTLRNLRGVGKLSEDNISDALAEVRKALLSADVHFRVCLLYTSPSPRDLSTSRMPSSA